MANQQQQQMQLNVDLKNTTSVETPDGGVVFQQGVVMPIPVFYDPKTGKILVDTLPPDLREEYKEYTIA